MAIVGNTVTISATFPNTIPNLENMTNVYVNVYTHDYKLLSTITNVTKVSTGNYIAQYTVTNKLMPNPLMIEMVGVVNGYSYLGRTQLNRTLV